MFDRLEDRTLLFKPYTHNVLGFEVLQDVLADGQVTVEGQEYQVQPKVVEALRDYPSFYNAGVVGPDGFPDLTMGQSIIHPESNGRWLRHVLDSAWAAQQPGAGGVDIDGNFVPYSDAEKSQILAWSYGYLTHVAGDAWAHTLVNEFAQGTFPAVGEILTDAEKASIALRHIVIENYIGDATPGFDGNSERQAIPEFENRALGLYSHADYSDDSTPGIRYDAPHRFIYETLIKPGVGPDKDHGPPLPNRGPLIDFFLNLRDLIEGDSPPNLLDALDNYDRTQRVLEEFKDECSNFRPLPLGLLDAAECAAKLVELGFTATAETVYNFTQFSQNTLKAAFDLVTAAYRNEWVKDIDAGLRGWSQLGLATTRALFDPQTRRDVQNDEARDELGSDSDPNSARASAENGIGLLDVVFSETGQFFTNESEPRLLSMFGLPDLVGDALRIFNELSDQIADLLDALGAPFNPIREGINAIEQKAKDLIQDQIEKRFGVNIDLLQDFFSSPSSWKFTADLGGSIGVISLFEPGDHEKLDRYLGITDPDHHKPVGIPNPPAGLTGGLKDDVTFDRARFAAFGNAVTLSKLVLLDGAEMDNVIRDLTGIDYYTLYTNNAGRDNLPHAPGGHVMITVLPGVGVYPGSQFEPAGPDDSQWFHSADADHAWRVNSLPIFEDKPSGGNGNFPLWESCLLRDRVFRRLFQNWELEPDDEPEINFPNYGDEPSEDLNERPPLQEFDAATGTWTITGTDFDDTFTITTAIDPVTGQPVIRISFPESTTYCEHSFQQTLADIRRIVIFARGGLDSFIVAPDIIVPVNIFGEGDDDTLTASYAGGPSRRITFDGGGQAGDTAILSGTGAMAGIYTPDRDVEGSGTITITGPDANRLTVDFSKLANATVSELGQLSFVASNGKNVLELDRPEDGRNRIQGESGGYGRALKLVNLTFFDVVDLTLDTRTNNTDSNLGDAIAIDRDGLVATGLTNFTISTGPGNDVLIVQSPSFALPVPGGGFAFDAGTGGSNLRGLISLDRIDADSDVNYTLTNDGLTSSGGGRIALSGVEGAVLTGGPTANVLDASRFSGPVVLNGGPGNDTLIGGSGNNTLNGDEGNDTLYAGDDGFHRPGLGSQANVLQGGGGINLLRGGAGSDTLYANLNGTATLMGDSGDDTFIITNPAGTVTDPAGGLVVVGGGQPGDTLRLVGGGGPTYNQIYIIGPDSAGPHRIAEPNSLGFTPGSPDAFLPRVIATIDHFDGQIVTTNNHNPTGPTISQFIRFTGLAAIDDSITADKLSVMGASASAPIAGASGTDLASGRMHLTVGGSPFAAITFANKTNPSVLLPGGQVITAASPAIEGTVATPRVITISTTETDPASLVTISPPPDTGIASTPIVQVIGAGTGQPVGSGDAEPAATGNPSGGVPSPTPVRVGPRARRFGAGRRPSGHRKPHRQATPNSAPHPKGPLGHRTAMKPFQRVAHRRPLAGK